jgi:hypothetical protein
VSDRDLLVVVVPAVCFVLDSVEVFLSAFAVLEAVDPAFTVLFSKASVLAVIFVAVLRIRAAGLVTSIGVSICSPPFSRKGLVALLFVLLFFPRLL